MSDVRRLAKWKILTIKETIMMTAQYCVVDDGILFFYVDKKVVGSFYLPNVICWLLHKEK